MNVDSHASPCVDELARRYAEGAGHWIGCDWPTVFGQTRLNLEHLRSPQAVLMARATAGKEAATWWAASRWLARIELEAEEAEQQARTAVALAQAGAWLDALDHARQACDVEARYHERLVWQSLRDALEMALKRSE